MRGKPVTTLLAALGMSTFGCGGPVRVKTVETKTGDAVAHYEATGGAVLAMKTGEGADYVCALPPAQGVKLLEQELTAKGEMKTAAGGSASGDLSAKRVESLAKLYEQTERNLFFQFALYRLCEAHANQMLKGRCDPLLDDVYAADDDATRDSALKGYNACLASCDHLKPAISASETLVASAKKDADTARAAKSADLDTKEDVLEAAANALRSDSKALSSCQAELTGKYSVRFTHVIEAALDLYQLDAAVAASKAEQAKYEAQVANAELAKARLAAEATTPNE